MLAIAPLLLAPPSWLPPLLAELLLPVLLAASVTPLAPPLPDAEFAVAPESSTFSMPASGSSQ